MEATSPMVCWTLGAWCGLVSLLPGQTVGGSWNLMSRMDGAQYQERLGLRVAGAGDLDGDGVPELLVSGGYPDFYFDGSVSLFSGATRSLIRRFQGGYRDCFGFSVAGAGDLDGDGVPDILIGAPTTQAGGSAFVYSGATGSTIRQFSTAFDDYLGASIADVGDVNGDGVPDLIVGAPLADPAGVVQAGSAYVYSGRDGSLIWKLDGTQTYQQFGTSTAGIGDVDADGVPDFLIGAPLSTFGRLNTGSVFVYSGATGTLLRRLDGFWMLGWFGFCVARAGDVDGDGVADFMVGSPQANPGGVQKAGRAYLYSGRTGDLIWRFDGTTSDAKFGLAVAGAGDVDGDGVPDLLAGTYWADYPNGNMCGYARAFSGRTGTLIQEFVGGPGEHLGAVAGPGDLNGDGLGEVLLGACNTSPGGVYYGGSAFVHSLDPFLHPDSRELSLGSGVPVQLELNFPPSEAGVSYVVLASGTGIGPTLQAGLLIPLTSDRLYRRMVGGWTPTNLLGGRGTLDPSGDAQATILSHPALAPYIGRTFYLAAVSYGPSSGRMSSIARLVTVRA